MGIVSEFGSPDHLKNLDNQILPENIVTNTAYWTERYSEQPLIVAHMRICIDFKTKIADLSA